MKNICNKCIEKQLIFNKFVKIMTTIKKPKVDFEALEKSKIAKKKIMGDGSKINKNGEN